MTKAEKDALDRMNGFFYAQKWRDATQAIARKDCKPLAFQTAAPGNRADVKLVADTATARS